MTDRIDKPLGIKAYGSIPHLAGSRRGPADRGANPGQQRICTERARDRHDRIVVTEKLDGSNVAVAKWQGEIIPLIRAGYRAIHSNYDHHVLFAKWAYTHFERFDRLLIEGERVVGEWLALAHGTRYDLPHEPFVPFDIMSGQRRTLWTEFADRVAAEGFTPPHLIHAGAPVSIESALNSLGPNGRHGALDAVEGIVYRVERKDTVEFLAKYVRPDKIDGCYLPEVSGEPAIWNWRPE